MASRGQPRPDARTANRLPPPRCPAARSQRLSPRLGQDVAGPGSPRQEPAANQLFGENRLFLLFVTHLRKVCSLPYPVLLHCTFQSQIKPGSLPKKLTGQQELQANKDRAGAWRAANRPPSPAGLPPPVQVAWCAHWPPDTRTRTRTALTWSGPSLPAPPQRPPPHSALASLPEGCARSGQPERGVFTL